jgi:hypothetical protein
MDSRSILVVTNNVKKQGIVSIGRSRVFSYFKIFNYAIYQSFPLSTSLFFWYHSPWWDLASSKFSSNIRLPILEACQQIIYYLHLESRGSSLSQKFGTRVPKYASLHSMIL